MFFAKYQGTGNDFVMIDNRNNHFPKQNHQLIAQICHRRFGVGADGLILLENTNENQHEKDKIGYDFHMIYYNADGYEGSMCGNGGRCAVRFAHHLGIFEQATTFLAVDGKHFAFLESENVHLQMIDIDIQKIEAHNPKLFYLNTGSPHVVELVENLDNYPVDLEGKKLRFDSRFNAGSTNVNFVEKFTQKTTQKDTKQKDTNFSNNDSDYLKVRTYERGVEAETYACGTGVTACALVMNMIENTPSPVYVEVLGGKLGVSFEKNIQNQRYQNIFLIGKAEKIFEGNFEANLEVDFDKMQ